MKKLYFNAGLIFLLSFTLISANAQSLLYYNNFNTSEGVWKNFDDQLSNSQIADGKYILTHKQHTSSIAASPFNVDETRDYAIETTVTHMSGEAYPIGITFGGLNSLNLYYFGISYSGQFTIASFQQGANKILVPWTVATSILKGTAPNKLRVEKSANQLKYFINDIQVSETPILPGFGSSIGLMVGGQQTASFDYLKIAYINPVAKAVTRAVQPVNAAVTQTIYHTDFDKDDENEWVLKPADSVTTGILNGYFNIGRTAKRGFTESVTMPALKVDMARNYLVETQAIHYTGTLNYGYGIDFACDTARQYHFWISPSGYYSIGYTHLGVYTSMTPWAPSDAIDKTTMAANKLTITHKDAQLIFYINDQQITSYPDLNFSGRAFGVSVASNQNVGFDYLTLAYLDKPPVIQNTAQADVTPPEIFVTSPQVTRGLKVVQSSDVLHVAGTAKDAGGIFSVIVNGVQAKVDASGNFTADIPMAIGDNPLLIVATDMSMNKGTYKFNIVRNNVSAGAQNSIAQSASQGKFYALLIGVQDYQDPSIQSLEGPVSDANMLLQALSSNYTFYSENITLLKNPGRAQFFQALDELSGKIKPEDNLVIFYAGHGFYDEDRHQGYWFPADAKRTRRDTWISNADLIDYITAIKSKHTLLISDACFSGSIFKTRSIEMAPKDIQELYKYPSRKAMTSGNMKEVPDVSVFMKYLVERLNQNTDKFLPSEQLFSSLRAAVINNSPNKQVPQFGEIRESGDEGGDFIFIKKD